MKVYIKDGIMMCTSLILLLFAGSACNVSREKHKNDFLAIDGVSVYYQLDNPSETFSLPKTLIEVSGISWLDDNRLLGVQDENGMVYEYDLEKGIVHTVDFEGKGDFEDLEFFDEIVYALKSDGTLYAFPYTSEKSVKPEIFETALSEDNDTEGLGYDPDSGSLLIACKESGEIKGSDVKGKAVYAFNIKEKKLITSPFFEITNEQVALFLDAAGNKVSENDIPLEFSAIAHNPADGYFYLLTDGLLIVLNRRNKIKATYPVSRDLLIQPEGICFSKNGDMFLSSEGAGFTSGYILKFTMKKK